jgi:gp16 family phage-associated protein
MRMPKDSHFDKSRDVLNLLDTFRARGVSIKSWAQANGFSDRSVYAVLSGQRKCIRGQSHKIAVALGLKAKLMCSTTAEDS